MTFLRLRLAALTLLTVAAPVILPLPGRAQGESMVEFNIESSPLVDNPWAGVESSTGDLLLPIGKELAVNDSGNIGEYGFSPSVAVGDLNGDGLPDLVVADSRGYIWFFPNSGTKNHAVFTHGEVLPVWFGAEDVRKTSETLLNLVPRIQLIDFNGDGKLDLVVGTYDGSLYMMPNSGSVTQPQFRQPDDVASLRIPTRRDGLQWCNYLAPFLYSWGGNGVLDLVMGEGTYSANSIYLLRNQGDNSHPLFTEDRTLRMIPGNGSEHLTPQVVDWNNDGKPDVISGERTGLIDLYLNTSTDPLNPTFDRSQLQIGSAQKFNQFTTLAVADLNGNKLPNLVIGSSDGRIYYATNSGTIGNPQFTTDAVPLTGVNPFPKIYQPVDWTLLSPWGNAYGLLVATNADVEKGFEPPPDHQGRSALRAYVFDPGNVWFKDRYIVDPGKEGFWNEHTILYKRSLPIQGGVRYEVTFNVKTDGEVEDTRYHLHGLQTYGNGAQAEVDVDRPYSASDSWNKVTDSFVWVPKSGPKNAKVAMKFSFRWHGAGSIYLDDVTFQQHP